MSPCACHADQLASVFAHGTERELSQTLVEHIRDTFARRGGELVTPELCEERARNAVTGFLDLLVRSPS